MVRHHGRVDGVALLVLCEHQAWWWRNERKRQHNYDMSLFHSSYLLLFHSHLSNSTPRQGTISRDRESAVRFGLSAEEVGLLLHQLPQQHAVELVRKPAPSEAGYDSPSVPHKVCQITPVPETAAVSFCIDFHVDGVGGHQLQNVQGPLTVDLQAGEVQVMMEIMRSTLPTLVGWSTMSTIAVQKAVKDAQGAGAPPLNDPFGFS